jgi:hypothetical protein
MDAVMVEQKTRWNQESLQLLLLVQSFLLVAEEESNYLETRTIVDWTVAEAIFNAFNGCSGRRTDQDLRKKWNKVTVEQPLLYEQLSCWIINGTFSDESNAYRSVLLLLESLKNGTLSDKWPQWCVLYNVGGGPFVFLYRIIQQVGASCGSYICVSTPSNTRIQIVAAFVTEGNIGESPVYR